MRKLVPILAAVFAMALVVPALARPTPKSTGGVDSTVGSSTNDAHASFTALDSKGQMEVHVRDADGNFVQRFHGTVDC